MTDAEKLKEIERVAGETGVGADEHAVFLAIEVLAIIDGSVTPEQVEAQVLAARYPMTVGEAFAAAVASIS